MRRLPLVLLIMFGATSTLAAADVTITKTDTQLEFRVGDELITKYQYGGTVQVEKGDGAKPLAKPFFYPVNAPGGICVTRPWPMVRGTSGETTDHFHQKSMWFCHGDVIADGLTMKTRSSDKRVQGVDFWAESAGHGRIVCTQVATKGDLATTTNEWRTPDGVKILDETRVIRVQSLPAGRLITLDIDLAANDYPIIFGDTKEGSMGIRISDEIMLTRKTGGQIVTSDGKVEKAPKKGGNLSVWGQLADWHDYSGTVGGKPVGLAVFDDANNTYRAVWHTRDYGLMAANPFGGKGAGFPATKSRTVEPKLNKGGHLKLRYGIYVHGGDASSAKVADVYATFMK
jgi:Methane oxygenase PmoA